MIRIHAGIEGSTYPVGTIPNALASFQEGKGGTEWIHPELEAQRKGDGRTFTISPAAVSSGKHERWSLHGMRGKLEQENSCEKLPRGWGEGGISKRERGSGFERGIGNHSCTIAESSALTVPL